MNGRPLIEDINRWDSTDAVIRKTEATLNIALYGFDISKLSASEQKIVIAQAERHRELEALKEKINPTPERELSKVERLEKRRIEALETKIDRIFGGRPLRELSNEDLKKQLAILKAIAKQ